MQSADVTSRNPLTVYWCSERLRVFGEFIQTSHVLARKTLGCKAQFTRFNEVQRGPVLMKWYYICIIYVYI